MVTSGPFASIAQCPWGVGFTPDSGRIAAPRRTDASGQKLPFSNSYQTTLNDIPRPRGGELTLEARLENGWQHIYRVIPYPRYDGEYEITNWYTATHPETSYQGNIIAAKPGPNRSRITMYNARVTVCDGDGDAEKSWLATESEFRDVLRGEFGLNMSDQEIDQCVAVMKAKGTGDTPRRFFAALLSL